MWEAVPALRTKYSKEVSSCEKSAVAWKEHTERLPSTYCLTVTPGP